jgi:hypothetical protein
MGYTDFALGKNARKASSGALGKLKGKPTDKMQTSGKAAIPGLQSGRGAGGGGSSAKKKK